MVGVALRPKTYAYLMDNGGDLKKARHKKVCNKAKTYVWKLQSLFNNKTVYRSQERFRSYYHDVYTEEVNKIALRSNYDKRLQTPDRITTYTYGTSEKMMINK